MYSLTQFKLLSFNIRHTPSFLPSNPISPIPPLTSGNNTVTLLKILGFKGAYACKKTGSLPYYSQQNFTLFILDKVSETDWYKQNINFYIYSKKISIFKSIISKVLLVLLGIFVVLATLALWGYKKRKKKLTGPVSKPI